MKAAASPQPAWYFRACFFFPYHLLLLFICSFEPVDLSGKILTKHNKLLFTAFCYLLSGQQSTLKTSHVCIALTRYFFQKKARNKDSASSNRAFWFSGGLFRRSAKDPIFHLFFFQYLFKFLHFPDRPALEIDLDISREFLIHKGLNHIDDLLQLFHGFRQGLLYFVVCRISFMRSAFIVS